MKFCEFAFECDQETAYELAAFSIEYLDAEGVYIAPVREVMYLWLLCH